MKSFAKLSRMLTAFGLTAMTLATLSMTGCLGDPTSLTLPMEYRPTSRVQTARFAGAIPSSAKVFIPPVEDKRADKMTIGANREDAKAIPVYAASAPADFFRQSVSREMMNSGLYMTDDAASATHTLSFELVRFAADEAPSYRADVVARAKLTDAKGNVRWEGAVNGYGTRFGRSLSAENYQEVLSDSLITLVEGMLSNASFQAALK